MWNVEILTGGTDDAALVIPITKKLFWVGEFSSTQFLVFFKNVFQKIIDEPVDENVPVAERLSEIASNKMIFYPFISIQQKIEYSDVTSVSDHLRAPYLQEKNFTIAAERLKMISDIKNDLGK